MKRIRVLELNGDTGPVLNYSKNKDGINAILIGGYKLSRGLTLPGLTTSYFLRHSDKPMYDTVMQMGRWFGYRDGYVDLLRLYCTRHTHENFKKISNADDELRRDIDDLFSDSPNGKYHYNGGFNGKGMLAWVLSGYIAVGTVWPNILFMGLDDFFTNLGGGGGYAWIIGASLGALIHLAISSSKK